MNLADPQDHIRSAADLAAHASELLDNLAIERAHVLGTSLGGFIAQELTLQRPELVDRLVLICPSHGGPKSKPPSWGDLLAMLGSGATNRADAARRGLKSATSDAYRAERPEEFAQVLQWRITYAPSQPAYLEQILAGSRFNLSQNVHDIRSPTLVLHGSEDRVVPVDNAVALDEAIPDSRLRIFEGAGHLVFIERAEELNEEILSFLGAERAPSTNGRVGGQQIRFPYICGDTPLLTQHLLDTRICAASLGGSMSADNATSTAGEFVFLVALLFLVTGALAMTCPLV